MDLTYLLDRAALHDLVHRYADRVRAGRGGDCGALFVRDATFEMRTRAAGEAPVVRTRLEGRDAIAAYVAQTTAAALRVVPLIHDLVVEIDRPHATGRAAMTALTIPRGDDLLGEYDDAFRLDDGVWRFAARTHTILLR